MPAAITADTALVRLVPVERQQAILPAGIYVFLDGSPESGRHAWGFRLQEPASLHGLFADRKIRVFSSLEDMAGAVADAIREMEGPDRFGDA